MTHQTPQHIEDYLHRYPRTVAHLICHSLGYATPTSAANILRDAHQRRSNGCEWIAACYQSSPRAAVRDALRARHCHRGYMGDYRHARALVEYARNSGDEPPFASWF